MYKCKLFATDSIPENELQLILRWKPFFCRNELEIRKEKDCQSSAIKAIVTYRQNVAITFIQLHVSLLAP